MVDRVETGKVQIGDDWPGVFIRGDNAAHFAIVLKAVLEGNQGPLHTHILEGLVKTLESSHARNGIEPVKLKRDV